MKDYSGNKWGRLTAIKFSHIHNRRYFWEFKCVCGESVIKKIEKVVSGNTRSCGCLRSECSAANGIKSKTHGDSKSKLYNYNDKFNAPVKSDKN
jgi:hypothetical protein